MNKTLLKAKYAASLLFIAATISACSNSVEKANLPGDLNNFAQARQAAEEGNAVAQYKLGLLLAQEQEDQQAIEWIRKSAAQGYAPAQNRLGSMYNEGKGTTPNHRLAIVWISKAAEQGHPEAQYNLANMLRIGRGTFQDEREAAAWYRKAAAQGYSRAQYSLGTAYFHGNGLSRDLVQAHKWLSLAASAGNNGAAKTRTHVEELMSPDQIQHAKNLAREWKASHDYDARPVNANA